MAVLLDAAINSHLDRLLTSRVYPKTICPSEIARALSQADLNAGALGSWRDAMPHVRRLIAERRDRGEVQVLQKNVVLEGYLGDGLTAVMGPLRARLVVNRSEEETEDITQEG